MLEKVGWASLSVSKIKRGTDPQQGRRGLTISTRGDERVERRACADPDGGGGHVGVVGPGPGSRGADDGCEDKGALHGVLFTS